MGERLRDLTLAAGIESKTRESKCPRQELNLRTWFRRPVLYPLSYGDFIRNNTILVNCAQNWNLKICLTKSIFCITIVAKRCIFVKIYELVIEPGREEHIARHQVTVEEVIFGAPFIRKARQGRYHIIGQTEAGRYLAVFVAPRGRGVYGLVTARDADDVERSAYLRQSKQKRL